MPVLHSAGITCLAMYLPVHAQLGVYLCEEMVSIQGSMDEDPTLSLGAVLAQ